VLQLAAHGTVTALSAGVVIGMGAVAGALLGLAGFRAYKKMKSANKKS
jgi:hypothetical protein